MMTLRSIFEEPEVVKVLTLTSAIGGRVAAARAMRDELQRECDSLRSDVEEARISEMLDGDAAQLRRLEKQVAETEPRLKKAEVDLGVIVRAADALGGRKAKVLEAARERLRPVAVKRMREVVDEARGGLEPLLALAAEFSHLERVLSVSGVWPDVPWPGLAERREQALCELQVWRCLLYLASQEGNGK